MIPSEFDRWSTISNSTVCKTCKLYLDFRRRYYRYSLLGIQYRGVYIYEKQGSIYAAQRQTVKWLQKGPEFDLQTILNKVNLLFQNN